MERKATRFELRLPAELGDAIDLWRRSQPDLPNRAEAARRLIEMGLANSGQIVPAMRMETQDLPDQDPPQKEA